MEFIKKRYNQTDVQISSFQPATGVAEYHLLFSLSDCMADYRTQLCQLMEAYVACKAELPGKPIAVFRRYFLSDVTNQAAGLMEQERLLDYCALSIVQQAPMNGTKIALWVWLQTDVQTQVIGKGLVEASHGKYRQLLTAGQCSRAANSEYQTRLIFQDYILQLTAAGCSLEANCLRTWLFVQNVDVNYAGVVKARKEVFATQNLTEKTHFIASTGIEGRYFDPMVFVTMDTYAVAGICPEQIHYLYAPTHLNRTYEYGVTFERGTAVTYGDRRHVFISGTASIDRHGEIVHAGDVLKQASRMFENIVMLLREADATLNNVMQAIVYIRDTADYQRVKDFIDREFPFLPYLIVRAPVCRPGWLIETECVAMVPEGNKRFAAF